MPEQPTDHIPRAEVNDLLAAVVEALDVGQAADIKDDAKAHQLLMTRVSFVSGALQYVLNKADSRLASATITVRRTAANYPVTYEPYPPTLGDEDTPWPDERAETMTEQAAELAAEGGERP
jgi:hypothetical protein